MCRNSQHQRFIMSQVCASTSLGKPVVANGDFSIRIAAVIRYVVRYVVIDVIAVLLSPTCRITAIVLYNM